ncbi:MAG: hypothetical protein A3K59_01270 [Euryarchaeota archaeon RBG_19FT_COMBO_69_17]|nr:MAG: hypothetical protein A3K59_01270 [Euryarchaeota archaeon RBG_19FT_COMBO_69_17]
MYLGVDVQGLAPSSDPNVVGVGIGRKETRGQPTEELALKFYVRQKLHPLLVQDGQVIPSEVEGVPTDVIEAGEFSIWRPLPPIYHRKVRPAMGGLSIGHYEISAGTFGCLARDRGDAYILSNNHVLANEGRGAEGDPILQPGRFDGGKTDKDVLARLDTYVALDPEGTNVVDAAIAQPYDPEDVTPDIINVGRLRGSRLPGIDEKVMKSGRTTRVTHGTVTDVDVTLRVGYSSGSMIFQDQFLVRGDKGSFSAGGDSGSTIVSYDGHAVGLLFAGSPFFTVANKMTNVEKALDVKVA